MKTNVKEPKELAAIEEFKNNLLSSKVGKSIAKIYLFGSVPKGTARPGSDIDLLIVANNGGGIRETVAELTFDFQMERKLPLEPLICELEELFPIKDYFIYNVIHNGREIYSMPKDKLKIENGKNLGELAEEYLDSSINALQHGYLRLAIDAAYNSAELAVKGLILLKIDDLPSSHGGIVGKFGELYIKKGLLDKKLGRELNLSLGLRNTARYKFTGKITKEDAELTIELARSLIEHLTKFLSS
jgi:uncharacterized protein (UPF0332 family)/predicted nucleotidyltransferase